MLPSRPSFSSSLSFTSPLSQAQPHATSTGSAQKALPPYFAEALANPHLANRAQQVVVNIQAPGNYANEGGDLVPQLLVRLPQWPANLALHIRNSAGQITAIYAPSAYRGNKKIAVVLNNQHYQPFDQTGKLVKIAEDGDCLFRSIVLSLSPETLSQLIGTSKQSDRAIIALRYEIAAYANTHQEEVKRLLLEMTDPVTYPIDRIFLGPDTGNTRPAVIVEAFRENSPLLQLQRNLSAYPPHNANCSQVDHSFSNPLYPKIRSQTLEKDSLISASHFSAPKQTLAKLVQAPSTFSTRPECLPSQKTIAEILQSYKNSCLSLPRKVRLDPALFKTASENILNKMNVDREQLEAYIKQDGALTLEGMQLIYPHNSLFRPLNVEHLRQWEVEGSLHSSDTPKSLAQFAQDYHLSVEQLKEFCKEHSGGLTPQGTAIIARSRGYKECGPSLVIECFTECRKAQLSTPPGNPPPYAKTIENFAKNNSLYLPELQHYFTNAGTLTSFGEKQVQLPLQKCGVAIEAGTEKLVIQNYQLYQTMQAQHHLHNHEEQNRTSFLALALPLPGLPFGPPPHALVYPHPMLIRHSAKLPLSHYPYSETTNRAASPLVCEISESPPAHAAPSSEESLLKVAQDIMDVLTHASLKMEVQETMGTAPSLSTPSETFAIETNDAPPFSAFDDLTHLAEAIDTLRGPAVKEAPPSSPRVSSSTAAPPSTLASSATNPKLATLENPSTSSFSTSIAGASEAIRPASVKSLTPWLTHTLEENSPIFRDKNGQPIAIDIDKIRATRGTWDRLQSAFEVEGMLHNKKILSAVTHRLINDMKEWVRKEGRHREFFDEQLSIQRTIERGDSLFAKKTFRPLTLLGAYSGILLSDGEELEQLEKEFGERMIQPYLYQAGAVSGPDKDKLISAFRTGNRLSLLNDASLAEPIYDAKGQVLQNNVAPVRVGNLVFLVTTAEIPEGAELFLDYGENYRQAYRAQQTFNGKQEPASVPAHPPSNEVNGGKRARLRSTSSSEFPPKTLRIEEEASTFIQIQEERVKQPAIKPLTALPLKTKPTHLDFLNKVKEQIKKNAGETKIAAKDLVAVSKLAEDLAENIALTPEATLIYLQCLRTYVCQEKIDAATTFKIVAETNAARDSNKPFLDHLVGKVKFSLEPGSYLNMMQRAIKLLETLAVSLKEAPGTKQQVEQAAEKIYRALQEINPTIGTKQFVPSSPKYKAVNALIVQLFHTGMLPEKTSEEIKDLMEITAANNKNISKKKHSYYPTEQDLLQATREAIKNVKRAQEESIQFIPPATIEKHAAEREEVPLYTMSALSTSDMTNAPLTPATRTLKKRLDLSRATNFPPIAYSGSIKSITTVEPTDRTSVTNKIITTALPRLKEVAHNVSQQMTQANLRNTLLSNNPLLPSSLPSKQESDSLRKIPTHYASSSINRGGYTSSQATMPLARSHLLPLPPAQPLTLSPLVLPPLPAASNTAAITGSHQRALTD